MMIDLDHFKVFNDEKGHLDGDLCLKAIADILRSHVTRGSDISARFGGDEFSVVLGDTPMEGALLVANRIMTKIRDLGMKISTGKAVTASIGLACGIPGLNNCTDEAAFIRLADSALYKAKSDGRNRIEVI
jgi:diguanylate cyclase (GGDEF)-like protein